MNDFADYCFCSTFDGDGEIYNSKNLIVWRFQTTRLKKRPAASGTGNGPIFALNDADGKELASISRAKRFPLAQFAVMQNDLQVGAIWQRSIWFTKYEFQFDNQSKWNLYMPMFSVSGRVVSDKGAEIWVRARTRRQWFARVAEGFDKPPMMTALAYVTRKKLQCT